jgi:hypothetical protein
MEKWYNVGYATYKLIHLGGKCNMKTETVMVGASGLQAFNEIHKVTSEYQDVVHVDYDAKEDVLVLDLVNSEGEEMKLTIEGVRRNRDVKNIIELKFRDTLEQPPVDD